MLNSWVSIDNRYTYQASDETKDFLFHIINHPDYCELESFISISNGKKENMIGGFERYGTVSDAMNRTKEIMQIPDSELFVMNNFQNY